MEKIHWPEAPETQKWANLEKELKSRKICQVNGFDILRWGFQTKGMFTIKEGYHIQSQNVLNNERMT